jgi:diketogulonate reductase-like aldo/keto reductase
MLQSNFLIYALKLTLKKTYKAMEQLLKTGKVKAIGVSNCDKSEMERLVKNSSIVPAVHQMECHPWLQQHDFTKWHRENGIHVTHYSPFGNQNSIYGEKGKGGLGKLIEEPVLAEIGEQYNKTAAQVALGKCDLLEFTSYGADCSVIYSLGSHAGPLGAAEVQDTHEDQGQPTR